MVERRRYPEPVLGEWLDKHGLPYPLVEVFGVDKDLPEDDPENETATLFWLKRDVLIRPLQEVSQLIESEDHWRSFAYELSWSGMKWSEQALLLRSEKIKKVTKIKMDIAKKANEIVNLANELEEIGEYKRTLFPSSSFYEYLFPMAAEIQNEAIYSEKGDFPGLYSGYRGNGLVGFFDMAKYCSYREDLEIEFRHLLATNETTNAHGTTTETMPMIECLILAYARSFEEKRTSWDHMSYLAQPWDPFEFSQRGSPGHFIRGFTSQLDAYVKAGHLPITIKQLSFPSIETFAGVLFPNRKEKITASSYIDAEWNPIQR